MKCKTTVPDEWGTEVDPNTTISIFWNQKVDPKVAHKCVKVQCAVTKFKKVKTTVVSILFYCIVCNLCNFNQYLQDLESTESVLVLRPEKPFPFSAHITVAIKPVCILFFLSTILSIYIF